MNNFLQSDLTWQIPMLICLAVFFIRLPYMCRPSSWQFHYAAATYYESKDHSYRFTVSRIRGGCYRCYIDQAPMMPGVKPRRYLQSYAVDPKTERAYIVWNGAALTTTEQAKTLCRNWANANQFFIDAASSAQ